MSNPYEKNDIVFWLGYNAFCMGLFDPPEKVAKNFYSIRKWQHGWNTAYFDNQKGTRLRRFEVQEKLNSFSPNKSRVQTAKAKAA